MNYGQAKREFEEGIATQAKTNPKRFWSHARSNIYDIYGLVI